MRRLDMGSAWNTAMAMLNRNRELVLVVAGVFFLLPYLAITLFVPDELSKLQSAGETVKPEVMIEKLSAFAMSYGWVFLLYILAVTVGTLSLMTLLSDRSRPTLGQAISAGFAGLPTYILASLIMGLGGAVVFGLPLALAGMTGMAWLVAVLGLFLLIVLVYVTIKLLLTNAVIAIDKVRNPVEALKRSWMLTKGNSLLIFAFVLLIGIAITVAGTVFQLVAALPFALMGAQAALIANGVAGGVVQAISGSLFAAIYTAIHRQLSGDTGQALSETFE